jgi:hypothetical protein
MADVVRSDQYTPFLGGTGSNIVMYCTSTQLDTDSMAMGKKTNPVIDPFCGSGKFFNGVVIRINIF